MVRLDVLSSEAKTEGFPEYIKKKLDAMKVSAKCGWFLTWIIPLLQIDSNCSSLPFQVDSNCSSLPIFPHLLPHLLPQDWLAATFRSPSCRTAYAQMPGPPIENEDSGRTKLCNHDTYHCITTIFCVASLSFIKILPLCISKVETNFKNGKMDSAPPGLGQREAGVKSVCFVSLKRLLNHTLKYCFR